jgi:hypothetical protein
MVKRAEYGKEIETLISFQTPISTTSLRIIAIVDIS